MKVYRICERKNGELLTLFHGINGSRKLPKGEWVTAVIKTVRDGSRKRAKAYQSGFHTLADLEETRKFTKRFTANRDLVIVECEIGGKIWKKEHSPANILLAEKIKINKIVEKVNI